MSKIGFVWFLTPKRDFPDLSNFCGAGWTTGNELKKGSKSKKARNLRFFHEFEVLRGENATSGKSRLGVKNHTKPILDIHRPLKNYRFRGLRRPTRILSSGHFFWTEISRNPPKPASPSWFAWYTRFCHIREKNTSSLQRRFLVRKTQILFKKSVLNSVYDPGDHI